MPSPENEKRSKGKSQKNKLNKKNDFLYLLIKNKIKNGLLPLTPAFHRDCKMLHEQKSENVVELEELLIPKNFFKVDLLYWHLPSPEY